jgi:hypothetical protein
MRLIEDDHIPIPPELRPSPHEIIVDDQRGAPECSPVVRIKFLDIAFPGAEDRFRSDDEHRPRAARPDEFKHPHERYKRLTQPTPCSMKSANESFILMSESAIS